MSSNQESDHNKAFGRVLADLRRGVNLSQEKLGFEAEMDRSFISLLERGKRSPTLDTLVRLCQVLHVSLSQLTSLVEAKLEEMNAQEERHSR
ncbi:helix-turn-helix transcriptional regulator (plasmid) [Stutzerimonas stutzeri]|uniref:helix-turn-helix domain-containing protein n=1 Tax=Stutzerimonas stutzeri group TaxID=136846 RepID=UPI000B4A0373|nr:MULTISPECIES: helix-turn-helix transcriptional regulator [Pseudomonadaceae]MBF8164730.1 helix-turn-helix transcriptional regulator [Pseudomonas mendocina]OWJ90244.1 transcriptional regulator [Pseudomonas sp. A46]QTF59143.1 helix-turn-helix transcriptional regulator [Stutzerimonas frequens]QUE78403.1 helix-turn-helix transcriptional regulator [Stutzerimonas stutzeri]